jgi:hypothetical protein
MIRRAVFSNTLGGQNAVIAYKPISYARAKNSRGGRIKAVETKQTIIQ